MILQAEYGSALAAQLPGRWLRQSPQAGEALSVQDELELLRACQAGDWSGYGLLVQRYRRLVWSAIDACAIPEDQAEDVVQGVFIRAYEKLGSFGFRSSFSTWLWRLARNHALSCRRSLARRPQPLSFESLARQQALPAGQSSAAAGSGGAALPAAGVAGGDSADPQEQYAVAARRQALRRMLDLLPREQREALNLCYAAGLSYEQIAAIMQLPVNTVRTKLFRGRQRLIQLAQQLGWEAAQ